jgi:hypothetical protein
MRRDEAYRYHDRGLAYLHGTRHAVRAMSAKAAATGIEKAEDVEPHIAIAVEGDDDDRRIVLRVRTLDEPTLATIAVMRALEHIPDDAPIEEIGQLFGLGAQDAVSPIQPGVACANELGPRGTIGCLVRSGGNTMLLSANHVLALENNALPNSDIVQPELGIAGVRVIGILSEKEDLTLAGNEMDAAVALVTIADINASIFNGVTITGVRATPLISGEPLRKFGQTTSETNGRYLGMASNVTLKMDSGSYSFDHQIEIDSTGGPPFSNRGDSGALVYDSAHRAVGILIGGNATTRTYVTPIDRILTRFNAVLL